MLKDDDLKEAIESKSPAGRRDYLVVRVANSHTRWVRAKAEQLGVEPAAVVNALIELRQKQEVEATAEALAKAGLSMKKSGKCF